MRSDITKKGIKRGFHRSILYGLGHPPSDLNSPRPLPVLIEGSEPYRNSLDAVEIFRALKYENWLEISG